MASQLNRRQEEFCIQWFKHRKVARHAYIAAGYAVKGLNVADAAASRLLRDVKIKRRIMGLQAMVQAKASDVTADTITQELEEARLLAVKCEQSGAAVSATVAKAKLVGLMVDRREVGDAGDFRRMSEAELRAFIKDNQPLTPVEPMLPQVTHEQHKTEQ